LDTLIILDFGSQYSQLIARRVREVQVYCELYPWNAPKETVLAHQPAGFILSGGPNSVYQEGAPQLPDYILETGRPVLGICYGMQALTHALGGRVAGAAHREYGAAALSTLAENPILPPGEQAVWMSHGDKVEQIPPGFVPLGQTQNAPFAAMGDLKRHYYGLQFHPEVAHTPKGTDILQRFAVQVCGVRPEWTPASVIELQVEAVRKQVGQEKVLTAVSGGVDSAVATALVHQAVGDQLTAVFVDTGLLRQDEAAQVVATFRRQVGMELIAVDAREDFFSALAGVTNPEEKRQIIGERFIRHFESQAKSLGMPPFLVQGTIYPDVIESRAPERAEAHRIKTHHNVGGLPEAMHFELVEPLRYLFKDEVRRLGEALGLPAEMVWRQPFPGPGLAVRCLGEVTPERVEKLQKADAIFTQELAQAGLLRLQQGEDGRMAGTSQSFAVLLPVRSVGVMGDQRTYQETIALRSVTSEDFMTADWARLPHPLLAKVSSRIVNEVDGVNRVVYDITSKPPSTIEWE
jgi:GMP synthase (glutamine-hydrolysing)